jgi:hypothetical protein
VGKFIEKALQVARKYSAWDWGFLKLTLVLLGIIIGVVFRDFVVPYMVPIFIIFGLSYIGLVYKTFFKYWGK